ncbi:calcium-binding protein CML24 [Salvia divinorum]|uniref:Calcium-binding protein CML24 n=1 Tax=Salvia divinorum TaxID=28513 RepID=A0ABD1FYR8_SALDI
MPKNNTAIKLEEVGKDDDLQAAFDLYDENKDGYISTDELKKAFKNKFKVEYSIKDCRNIIYYFAKGAAGVSFKEFTDIVTRNY